ncbi:MAG: hypothetical protein K2P99_02515, partial [Burkholderiales bacterium]|nr:hypothetical protein [Burkholderiales bacterium]
MVDIYSFTSENNKIGIGKKIKNYILKNPSYTKVFAQSFNNKLYIYHYSESTQRFDIARLKENGELKWKEKVHLFEHGFEIPLFPLSYQNKKILISYRYGAVNYGYTFGKDIKNDINVIIVREFNSAFSLGKVLSISPPQDGIQNGNNLFPYFYSEMLFLYSVNKNGKTSTSTTALIDRNLKVHDWLSVSNKITDDKYLLPGQVNADAIEAGLLSYSIDQIKELIYFLLEDIGNQIEGQKTLKLLLNTLGNQVDIDLLIEELKKNNKNDSVNILMTLAQAIINDSSLKQNELLLLQESLIGKNSDSSFINLVRWCNKNETSNTNNQAVLVTPLKNLILEGMQSNSLMNYIINFYMDYILFTTQSISDNDQTPFGNLNLKNYLSYENEYSRRIENSSVICDLDLKLSQINFIYDELVIIQQSNDNAKTLEYAQAIINQINSTSIDGQNIQDLLIQYLELIIKLNSSEINKPLFSGWWDALFSKNGYFKVSTNSLNRAQLIDWWLDTCHQYLASYHITLIKALSVILWANNRINPQNNDKIFTMVNKQVLVVVNLLDNVLPRALLSSYLIKTQLSSVYYIKNNPSITYTLMNGRYVTYDLKNKTVVISDLLDNNTQFYEKTKIISAAFVPNCGDIIDANNSDVVFLLQGTIEYLNYNLKTRSASLFEIKD